MKTKHLKSLCKLAAVAGSMLFAGLIYAGTVVGPFPQFNGGFEGETVQTVPTQSSYTSNTTYSAWTVSSATSANGTGPNIIATGGRSGPYYVSYYNNSTSSRRLQSPTTTGGAVLPSTSYVVQFYYRTANSQVVSNFQGGVSTSGTTLSTYSTTANYAGTSGSWTKFSAVITSSSTAVASTSDGIGIVRFSTVGTNAADVDDFCVYQGSAVDTTAPDPVTSPAISGATGGSLNVGWTAPGTGVDGGGYLVVRGTSDPTTAPNVNGIYAIGNTVAAGQTVVYIGTGTSFTDTGLNPNTTYYYRIYTVDKAFNYSTAVTANGTTLNPLPPIISSDLSPVGLTTNAGSSVTFTVGLSQGSSPLTYYWFKEGVTTNLYSTTVVPSLTIPSVLMADSTNYQVIVSNSIGTATSSVVALTVTGDPSILTQPVSQPGLLKGRVQFSLGAVGTGLSYQWYFADPSGNIIAPVGNITQPSGSVISGANTATLTITNLQLADATNFIVVATGTYGTLTSAVATLTVGTTQVPLAFWNFNGTFNPTNPVPYQGVGTALLTNCTGFAQTSADGLDGTGGGQNYGWGTSTYPASGQNTNAGVQFNVNTVGAKNITVSFDSRATSTASKYFQLQYTTNGIGWINYPVSSAFTVASSWQSFSFNLAGFAGVANNTNFGIRIVTEYESTASYGATNDAQYVGVSSTYSSSGTFSFDLVTISADAITNAFAPPIVSAIANTNTVDDTPISLNFTVGGSGPFALSGASLNQTVLSGAPFTFGASGANSNLTVNLPDGLVDGIVPVLITAANPSGDITSTWFYLAINPANFPPTNTLTSIAGTNLLANHSITIPFTVGDDRTALSGLTFVTNSGNSTLAPNANITVGGSGASRTVTITPVVGQVGVVPVSVTVNDNDATSTPKSTTATFPVMVVPNTNIVFVDNFNYDVAGDSDLTSAGLWSLTSGVTTHAQPLTLGSGAATISQANNECFNANLIGAPYTTNSGATLYTRFVINCSTLPTQTGNYFEHLLDRATLGSGAGTAYGARVFASTLNAASGYYRVGIGNGAGATNTIGQLAVDLAPNVNYTVVTRFVLSTGVATVWVNPTAESSPSATATDLPPATGGYPSNAINVTSVALRQGSGGGEGVLTVSNLMVGLTFNSLVYNPPVANSDSYAITENSSGNVFSPLLNDTPSGALSLVSVSPTNGSATISGTNVLFTPTVNFIGTANIGYVIADGLGGNSTNVITVAVTNIPPQANPDTYTVLEYSTGNVFNPLTNDLVKTTGGSLHLVSASSSAGTVVITNSSQQIVFTPSTGYNGSGNISYQVTDGIGGTSTGTITVNVTFVPPAVTFRTIPGNIVIQWVDSNYNLQSATNVVGPYLNVPGASSPFTNDITTLPALFFRLAQPPQGT